LAMKELTLTRSASEAAPRWRFGLVCGTYLPT
jgi:hypothetical protein